MKKGERSQMKEVFEWLECTLYGLERQIYPVPHRLLEGDDRHQGYKVDRSNEISEVSPHNQIRQTRRLYAGDLLRLDRLFSKPPPEGNSDDVIAEYENLVERASVEGLISCDVILCTCICSADRRIVTSLNVEQIVVDEYGMCTEPACLVPLVRYPSARQVALIGDHKQLQPFVVNHVARRFCPGKSLFERHALRSNIPKRQYRMVGYSLIASTNEAVFFCLQQICDINSA